MIRVALFSQDVKLQPLLAPALGRDFEVMVETHADRLSELLQANPFDILILDLDSENSRVETHIDVFNDVNHTGTTVVILTDDACRPTAIDLVQRGAHSYCRKPPAMRELKAMMRRAYEHVVMKRQLEASKQKPAPEQKPEAEPSGCDALIGSSAPMRNVYDLIRRVASLNASVLITGESGTGKELIAKAIHNIGDRKAQPFVAVSCGAIPETLIESELFGHEKGAFTGTTGTRTGYFEQAGNGTLLLDEIGELSPQTQVKLLRILQQKEFCRLGSGRAIPLRARVLFATHRDLAHMIEERKFRLDLYYRINVMTIHAPSLAERPEDIGALAKYFLRQYSDTYNKVVTSISAAALATLEDYDWPGNVRELENVIQSAIIRADTEEIQPKDLPDRMRAQDVPDEVDVPETGTFERLLRDYKVKLALKAIEDCDGNKTLAARSLNISRAYLHRLIRQAGEVEAIDAA